MSVEKTPTARTLFLEAVENHPPERWPAFLDSACGQDDDLRGRVAQLLEAHAGVNSFMAQPAGGPVGIGAVAVGAATLDHTVPEAIGTSIGRYKLLEQIGEGGMGVVYVAEQTEPVRRKVALKVIKPGMDSRQVIARFEAERQALAMMDHPHIARVLDGGATDTGRPYFVMELVRGLPITEYCDQARLTPRQRLEIFVDVCQAVQHAHQKGIIHRDLKPSNVLVTLHDGAPVAKVIDFGVAKALHQQLSQHTVYTAFSQVVGTPLYMSPEQAEMSGLDVDTRSDVYSLGVLLYELLTGQTPFDAATLRKAGLDEMRRIIREDEPPRPSQRISTLDAKALSTLSQRRGIDERRWSHDLRGELDWIAMKAIEKDRNRRYESASAFAADVQRYLDDLPVEARPASKRYRFGKFLRRNKGPVAAAAVVLAALLAGMVGTTLALVRAIDAEGVAEERLEDTKIALAKAQKAEDETLEAYRASTADAIEQLIGSKPELGPQERTYLENTLKRWQAFAARQGTDERSQAIRGEGHFRVAGIWAKLGRNEEARAEYQAARDLQKKLVEQFPAVPEYQRDLAKTHSNLGILLADLGKREEARAEYLVARNLQGKLVEQFPTVPEYQQGMANTHVNLGIVLADLGETKDARAELESARDLQERLVEQFPAVPTYQQQLANIHNSLGIRLADLGEKEKARAEWQSAHDIQEKLVKQFPAVPAYQQAWATTHNSLGGLLADLGEQEGARAEYQAARDLLTKLVEQFPAVPLYQKGLAKTHSNLGLLLAGLGENAEARAEFQAARDLGKKLVEQFPAVPEYQRDLAKTHSNLGILLAGLGNREEARAEYQAARDLQTKLVEQFPAVPIYKQDLARTHNARGVLLAGLGKRAQARAEYQAAREVQERLVEQFPAVSAYQIELGGSYCNHGNLLRSEGEVTDSVEWFDLAISTLSPVHEREPRGVTAKQFLRNSHMSLALAYDQLRKPAEAVDDWTRALELSSPAEQPIVRAGRSSSLSLAGQSAEAVAEVAELTKNETWDANTWYNFACVYAVASGKIADKRQEYADRAMELLTKAVAAGWSNAAHTANDPDLAPLREREDFRQLLASLPPQEPQNPATTEPRASATEPRASATEPRASASGKSAPPLPHGRGSVVAPPGDALPLREDLTAVPVAAP